MKTRSVVPAKLIVAFSGMLLLMGCEALPTGGGGGSSNEDPAGAPTPQLPCLPEEATWLVVAGPADDPDYWVSATAFGLSSKYLATNAHVVSAIEEAYYGSPDAVAIAVQHETGATRNLEHVWRHPDYEPDSVVDTPDVGLLRVSEDLPCCLSLADDDVLEDLAARTSISLCGFPGELLAVFDFDDTVDLTQIANGTLHPRATCYAGTISALRPFDPDVPATPENRQLLQYNLPVTGGTSGSAICDENYNVIGINSAGFDGVDINFGIRGDLVRELLDSVESGELLGVPLRHEETDEDARPRDGTWEGTTSQNQGISFRVSGDGTSISDLTVGYTASSLFCLIEGTITWSGSDRIDAGGSFSAGDDSSWSSTQLIVSGEFISDTEAEGDAYISSSSYDCGSYGASPTWTASWLSESLECETDADCDDGLFCNGSEECWGVKCQDGTPPCGEYEVCNETDDTCESEWEECDTDADCDDGLFCNGAEECWGGECWDGWPPCSDSEVCSEAEDTCELSWQECETDADCDDGLFCNGVEQCLGSQCGDGWPPCSDSQVCNEAQGTCDPRGSDPVAEDQSLMIEVDSGEHQITLVATDLDYDPLIYTIVTTSNHGTLSGTGDGDAIVFYTPEASFIGKDSFTFQANDGSHDSNEATVFITVAESWEEIAQPPVWYDGVEVVTDGNDVYLLGGGYASSAYGAATSCYKYDPSTDSWTQKSDMQTPRRMLGVAVLSGAVYAIGGGDYGGASPTKSVEKYEPATDTWVFVAPLNIARSRIGTTVSNGNIYVFGGYDGSQTLRTIEVYDPSGDAWTLPDDMLPQAYEGTSAVTVGNMVYVFGSRGTFRSPDLWQYNPSAPSGSRWFQQTSPESPVTDWGADEPNAASVGHYLTYIPDNSLDAPVLLLFDTGTFAWSNSIGPIDDHGGGASVGFDGYLYAIGGYTHNTAAERFFIGP